MTTTSSRSHKEVLFKDAILRASSYSKRHSTLAANLFFQNWDNGYQEEEEELFWNSLPDRIHALTIHYQRIDNDTDGGMDIQIKEQKERSITLSNDFMEARRIALTASILNVAPEDFWEVWVQLFREILQAHMDHWDRLHKEQDDSEDEESEDEDSIEITASVEQYVMDKLGFDETNLIHNLHTLQWLNALNPAATDILTRPLNEALHQTITQHVESVIEGEYEEDNLLESLEQWKDDCIVPLLENLLQPRSRQEIEMNIRTSPKSSSSNLLLTNWKHKLNHTLSQSFCTTRKHEIFDMVKEYPSSLPAIHDLHRALQQTHMTSQFIQALRGSFQRRLLHPGAQTQQILQVYMNTSKVLRVIDPTDKLLEGVAVDIRSYLRGRSDTVKCIITSLTDEEAGGDLYEELQRHEEGVIPLEDAPQYSGGEREEEEEEDGEPPSLDWMPAPSLYYQRTTGTSKRQGGDESGGNSGSGSGDLLSMLVGIYGSNDLFVDEYRIRLADKLLANVDFDTDREVHNLELLKLRFGETSMRQCEIMIKDMDDSKRIAANIHSTLQAKLSAAAATANDDDEQKKADDPEVDAAIISHIFWPPLQKDPLKNHPRIQTFLDQYSMEYAKYKNPRRLVWFSQLGQVQLELDVMEEDQDSGEMVVVTKEFTCSPLQGTLISHFEDNDGVWTLADLSNETGVSEDVVRKKMGYWVNNRVVKRILMPNTNKVAYELVSLDESSQDVVDGQDERVGDRIYEEEEDDDGLVVSLSAQEEEEIQAYKSYVTGMLANLGQLPLERIHNMLKMFVTGSEHKYNMTPQQLSGFLQQLCKEEKIECGADGMYKLLKK